MTLLTQLVEGLDSGRVRIVDLTQSLGPETPVIGLPPQFGASPGVTSRWKSFRSSTTRVQAGIGTSSTWGEHTNCTTLRRAHSLDHG